MSAICSDCGNRLDTPLQPGGNRYKCKACGGVTEVTAHPQKVCFACGADVASQKRVKDARGNYYCHHCWAARASGFETEPSAQLQANVAADWTTDATADNSYPMSVPTATGKGLIPPQPVFRYPCTHCGGLFAADWLYDQGGFYICHNCYERATSEDSLTVAVSAASVRQTAKRSRSRNSSAWMKIAATCMLVAAFAGGGYALWRLDIPNAGTLHGVIDTSRQTPVVAAPVAVAATNQMSAQEAARQETEQKKQEEAKQAMREAEAQQHAQAIQSPPTRGKLVVAATYFYNDFQGDKPNEAAVWVIPKSGLTKKIPSQSFLNILGTLKVETFQDKMKEFMKSQGGDFGWAGGDGKVTLRLPPGKYELLVLMDIQPYFSSKEAVTVLQFYFDNPEFCRSHAVLGRFATAGNVEVVANDTEDVSINLK